MGAAAPTGHGVRAARLFALLALLLGLLAMHGLASSHHATAAVSAQQHDVDAAEPAADHSVAPPTVSAHRDASAAAVEPAGASCNQDCLPGLAMLCLAVLATTAIAAVLARRRRRISFTTPRHERAPDPSPPGRLPPRPDPVAELCVSRT